jgi:hypothetical protein
MVWFCDMPIGESYRGEGHTRKGQLVSRSSWQDHSPVEVARLHAKLSVPAMLKWGGSQHDESDGKRDALYRDELITGPALYSFSLGRSGSSASRKMRFIKATWRWWRLPDHFPACMFHNPLMCVVSGVRKHGRAPGLVSIKLTVP